MPVTGFPFSSSTFPVIAIHLLLGWAAAGRVME